MGPAKDGSGRSRDVRGAVGAGREGGGGARGKGWYWTCWATTFIVRRAGRAEVMLKAKVISKGVSRAIRVGEMEETVRSNASPVASGKRGEMGGRRGVIGRGEGCRAGEAEPGEPRASCEGRYGAGERIGLAGTSNPAANLAGDPGRAGGGPASFSIGVGAGLGRSIGAGGWGTLRPSIEVCSRPTSP